MNKNDRIQIKDHVDDLKQIKAGFEMLRDSLQERSDNLSENFMNKSDELQAEAVTVRQPFAREIVDGNKTIELRSRKITHRGPLYIHAGKKEHEHHPGLSADGCTFGAILGHVDVVAVIPMNRETLLSTWNQHLYDVDADTFPAWGWVLENPVKFDEPIPYAGKLGLFSIPKELVS